MEFQAVDLNSWTILRISGPDKLAYLNGITTFDLEKLTEIKICQSAFLTPNAKIRSIFWLAVIDDSYILYAPPQMREALIEDLLKYKLDMNVKLEDVKSETPPLYLLKKDLQTEYTIKLGADMFEFHQTSEILESKIEYDVFKEWLVINKDIPIEILIDQNPFEVGISNAITLEKGCFLGQEPLSRMYHRGRPRKYLYQIVSNLKLSDKIFMDGNSIGNVVHSVRSDDNYVSIAYIKSSVDVNDELNFDDDKQNKIVRIGSYLNFQR